MYSSSVHSVGSSFARIRVPSHSTVSGFGKFVFAILAFELL
jgi:hypothetical protein